MPEHVSRLDSTLPEFPAAAGRGAIFSPLAQSMHEAGMRAHTVIWRDKKDQVTRIVIDPRRDQIGDRIAA